MLFDLGPPEAGLGRSRTAAWSDASSGTGVELSWPWPRHRTARNNTGGQVLPNAQTARPQFDSCGHNW